MTPSQSSGMTTWSCSTTSASTCVVDGHDRSIYARAWRFVQRRLRLRPRACSCPVAMKTTKNTAELSSILSAKASDWQRVHLLKELETYHDCIPEKTECSSTDAQDQPRFRTQAQRKAAQVTCYNCGLLFFRLLSVAPNASAFCGRDCQSTFEYRRDLQVIVNERESVRAKAYRMRSSEL